MSARRFVLWYPVQAIWMALFAVLFIQLSGAQNVCYLGACTYNVTDHIARSATHRLLVREAPERAE